MSSTRRNALFSIEQGQLDFGVAADAGFYYRRGFLSGQVGQSQSNVSQESAHLTLLLRHRVHCVHTLDRATEAICSLRVAHDDGVVGLGAEGQGNGSGG